MFNGQTATVDRHFEDTLSNILTDVGIVRASGEPQGLGLKNFRQVQAHLVNAFIIGAAGSMPERIARLIFNPVKETPLSSASVKVGMLSVRERLALHCGRGLETFDKN